MMEVTEAIVKRKSVRAYLDKAVPGKKIEKIVEAGRWAPNTGPFHISVIRNQGVRQTINDRTLEAMRASGIGFLQQRAALPGYQPMYGAPVLILLSGPKNSPFSTVNAALSAENMLLEATGLGLGSCYLVSPTLALNGDVNRDLAREAGIPDGYALACAVIVGYAAEENKFTPDERTIKGSVGYID